MCVLGSVVFVFVSLCRCVYRCMQIRAHPFRNARQILCGFLWMFCSISGYACLVGVCLCTPSRASQHLSKCVSVARAEAPRCSAAVNEDRQS